MSIGYQKQQETLANRIIAGLCYIKDYPCELLPHIVFVEEVGEDGGPIYNKYSLISINQKEKTCMLKSCHSQGENEYNLASINIDWLVTVWNRCQELMSEPGKVREHAVCYLLEHTDAEPDYIAEYVDKNWRLSFPDEANLATFNECRKQVDCSLETCLRNLLEVALVRVSGFKQSAMFRDCSEALKNMPMVKEMKIFLYSIYKFERNASNEDILKAWDENDDSIEVYTIDELATILNDGDSGFSNHWVRVINV